MARATKGYASRAGFREAALRLVQNLMRLVKLLDCMPRAGRRKYIRNTLIGSMAMARALCCLALARAQFIPGGSNGPPTPTPTVTAGPTPAPIADIPGAQTCLQYYERHGMTRDGTYKLYPRGRDGDLCHRGHSSGGAVDDRGRLGLPRRAHCRRHQPRGGRVATRETHAAASCQCRRCRGGRCGIWAVGTARASALWAPLQSGCRDSTDAARPRPTSKARRRATSSRAEPSRAREAELPLMTR